MECEVTARLAESSGVAREALFYPRLRRLVCRALLGAGKGFGGQPVLSLKV